MKEPWAKGAAVFAGNEMDYRIFIEGEAGRTGKTIKELEEENLMTGEIDKRFAVSTGAGVSGALRINITNVLSRTYGLETQDTDRGNAMRIFNMLMINEKLPATRTETFYTVSNNQDGISIKVHESRSTEHMIDIEGRMPLTEIEMKFTQRVPEGTGVVMTTALDNSGFLHIMAEEQLYHSKLDTTFQLSNQMSADEAKSVAMRMEKANVE